MTVLEIQRALIARGYSIAADGQMGQETEKAIEAFQKSAGLTVDGVAGPKTQAALTASSAKPIATAGPSGAMTTSPEGRAKITAREGNILKAYLDSVGVFTIGVGHTSAAGPPVVTKGMRITAAESDEILSRDLSIFEKAVTKAVKVDLRQNEFDALVSLAFNIGAGAFSKSTLVKKLNAGNRAAAADQFLVWNKAGGRVLKGLAVRRADERKQFLS